MTVLFKTQIKTQDLGQFRVSRLDCNWPPILLGRWTLWGLHCQCPPPHPNPIPLQRHPRCVRPRKVFLALAHHPDYQQIVFDDDRQSIRSTCVTRRLLVFMSFMFWWWSKALGMRLEARICWPLNCRQYPVTTTMVVRSTFSPSDLTVFPSHSIKESLSCSRRRVKKKKKNERKGNKRCTQNYHLCCDLCIIDENSNINIHQQIMH